MHKTSWPMLLLLLNNLSLCQAVVGDGGGLIFHDDDQMMVSSKMRFPIVFAKKISVPFFKIQSKVCVSVCPSFLSLFFFFVKKMWNIQIITDPWNIYIFYISNIYKRILPSRRKTVSSWTIVPRCRIWNRRSIRRGSLLRRRPRLSCWKPAVVRERWRRRRRRRFAGRIVGRTSWTRSSRSS